MAVKTTIAAACLLLLTACGSDTATDGAADPADPGSSGQPSAASTGTPTMPTAIPGADGPVSGLGTVIDGVDGPQLCLGPIAESYPPQCSGLPLVGWVWSAHHGEFDHGSAVRFGSFLVTGTFDGTAMTYDSAVSSALYDPARMPDPTSTATGQHTQAELDAIAEELRGLPGALTTTTGDNLVVADVVHDDGALQAWADTAYGAGLVVVRPALVAVGQQ